MAEPVFKEIVRIKKCPACGSTRTVAREVVGPDFPRFVSLRKHFELKPKGLIATTTPEVVVSHFDACAECGQEYLTKAEVGKVNALILLASHFTLDGEAVSLQQQMNRG